MVLSCSASACLVDRGLDPLKKEKQARSVACRTSRAHSHQFEVGTTSELYESGLVPWDIEMTVEDPVSDDEDGSPHRVSDSGSESESEQDSE